MKKRGWWLLFSVVALLLAIKTTDAIGISPVTTDVEFMPNKAINISFSVLNTGTSPIEVFIAFNGELARYITLHTNSSFPLGPTSSRKIDLTLSLPPKIEPGKNAIEIIAREVPSAATKGIAAFGAVSGYIYITAPYPSTYATISLQGHDANLHEPITLTTTASNLGKYPIQNMVVVVNTYDNQKQQEKERWATTIPLLNPRETKDLVFSLNPARYEAGTYIARAYGKYHATATNEEEITFRIGHLFVNITNVNIIPYPEQIYKFMIDLESVWDAPLDEVYATIAIKDVIQQSVGEVKTPTVSLGSWSKETLTSFWDAKALSPGEYRVDITVHYQEKTTTMTTSLLIQEPPVQREYAFIMIGIITLILIIDYLWLHKKNKRSQQKEWQGKEYKL